MRSWADRQAEIAEVAGRQLFFIGGAPRSGTTWLQQILDCHPDISCRGEGLFTNHLLGPLEAMMEQRRQALEAKNTGLFQHTGGYPLPTHEDVAFLGGTAILLALRQQSAGRAYRAIGEKTPENVFLFPRLRALFPAAKFIALARDPRDVLTSAWHFFRTPVPPAEEIAAKTAFIQSALPSLNEGARATLAFAAEHPAAFMLVTYEGLRATTAPVVAQLFRFLGVSDAADLVTACVERTSFAALTGGRPAGVAQNGSFYRKGVAGDWRTTLTPEMNQMMLQELGWMFPHFGWHF